MSDNPFSADNQQERFRRISFDEHFKWYLTGFVDGEGSFCISVKKHPTAKFGWQIDPSFYLYQHENHLWILEAVKEFFGAGSIHRKSNPGTVYTYALHGIRQATTKVIPFFQAYPLLVKSRTFNLFVEAVNLMAQKVHLTSEGFERVLRIAHSLNTIGKGRKWSIEHILGKSSETVRQTRASPCIEMIQSELPGDRKSAAEMLAPLQQSLLEQ